MRVAYFDCFSGVSGDMILGALVDAGVPLSEIRRGMRMIPVRGYVLREEKVSRKGISATRLDVRCSNPTGRGKSQQAGAPDTWRGIRQIIDGSALPTEIREKGRSIFQSLFDAEARVHGKPREKVHLHELGSPDAVVDVFGALIGLSFLKVDAVYCSPLNLGGGLVETRHGILPVPAPATVELLKGLPVYSTGLPFELTTPTGAAILKAVASWSDQIPRMTLERVGTGAGSRDLPEQPNVLRLMVGVAGGSMRQEEIIVVETNIDDMNPQVYEHLMDRLFRLGALDVYMTQVVMKKSRPGIKLSVLCGKEKQRAVADLLLKETTTLGVRSYGVQRTVLARRWERVKTPYGAVRVKIARLGDGTTKAMPEYDDCKALADEKGVPLLAVLEEARSRGR